MRVENNYWIKFQSRGQFNSRLRFNMQQNECSCLLAEGRKSPEFLRKRELLCWKMREIRAFRFADLGSLLLFLLSIKSQKRGCYSTKSMSIPGFSVSLFSHQLKEKNEQ